MVIIYILCYYPGPATPGQNYEICKVRFMYVSGKKPRLYPKGWIGHLVRLLHHKAGGATDGAKNIILMMRMEEKLTPIKIKIWVSWTVSM